MVGEKSVKPGGGIKNPPSTVKKKSIKTGINELTEEQPSPSTVEEHRGGSLISKKKVINWPNEPAGATIVEKGHDARSIVSERISLSSRGSNKSTKTGDKGVRKAQSDVASQGKISRTSRSLSNARSKGSISITKKKKSKSIGSGKSSHGKVTKGGNLPHNLAIPPIGIKEKLLGVFQHRKGFKIGDEEIGVVEDHSATCNKKVLIILATILILLILWIALLVILTSPAGSNSTNTAVTEATSTSIQSQSITTLSTTTASPCGTQPPNINSYVYGDWCKCTTQDVPTCRRCCSVGGTIYGKCFSKCK